MAAVLALAGMALPASPLRATDTPRSAITVVVYNYAKIESKTLGDSKRVAGRILREAGIGTRWLNASWGDAARAPSGDSALRRDAPSEETFGPATLVLRLLPGAMVRSLGFQPDYYGFAQCAPEGGFAFTAGVFCQRAERLARGVPSRVPVILGHLMAHEIGHLLLGPFSHSNEGIMRAPWGEQELRRAFQVGLRFSAIEASRMRSNVAARLQAATDRSATAITKHHAEPESPLRAAGVSPR